MASRYKSFETLQEQLEGKTCVFVFGRFNPPTRGHDLLLTKALEVSKERNADLRVYTGFTVDSKKNPLSHQDKIKYLRLFFPKIKAKVWDDPEAISPFHVMKKLSDEGYEKVILVCGSDRVEEFIRKTQPLLNSSDPAKALHFEFEVVSAGIRDEDSDDVSGMSGTKAREAAKMGDYTKFQQIVPDSANERFVRELYNDVRVGMGERPFPT